MNICILSLMLYLFGAAHVYAIDESNLAGTVLGIMPDKETLNTVQPEQPSIIGPFPVGLVTILVPWRSNNDGGDLQSAVFYGNWCGLGNKDGPCLDAIDCCCMQHDICWEMNDLTFPLGWFSSKGNCNRDFKSCIQSSVLAVAPTDPVSTTASDGSNITTTGTADSSITTTAILAPLGFDFWGGTSDLLAVRTQYVEPAWWPYVVTSFDGVRLQRCVKRNGIIKPVGPPPNGQSCSRRPKTCFFGDQDCDGVPHPATQCFCDGNTWQCSPTTCSSPV